MGPVLRGKQELRLVPREGGLLGCGPHLREQVGAEAVVRPREALSELHMAPNLKVRSHTTGQSVPRSQDVTKVRLVANPTISRPSILFLRPDYRRKKKH